MRFQSEVNAISDVITRLETACSNELSFIRGPIEIHIREFKDSIITGEKFITDVKATVRSYPGWLEVFSHPTVMQLFNDFSEVYQQDIQAVDLNKIIAVQRIRNENLYKKNTVNIDQFPKGKLRNLRSLRNACYEYFDCVVQVIDVVVSAKQRVIVKVWDGFQHSASDKLFYLPDYDHSQKICSSSVYSIVGKEYNVEILVYGCFARDAKLLKPGDIVLFVNVHLAVTGFSTWNLTMHEGGLSFKRGIYHISPTSHEYSEVESRCMRSLEDFINKEDSFNIECLVSDLRGQNELHSNAIREHAKNGNTDDTSNSLHNMISNVLSMDGVSTSSKVTETNKRRSLLETMSPRINKKRISEPVYSSSHFSENVYKAPTDSKNQQPRSGITPRKTPVASPSTLHLSPITTPIKETSTPCGIYSGEDELHNMSVETNQKETIEDFLSPPSEELKNKLENTSYPLPAWLFDKSLPEEIWKKFQPIERIHLSSTAVERGVNHSEFAEVVEILDS